MEFRGRYAEGKLRCSDLFFKKNEIKLRCWQPADANATHLDTDSLSGAA